MDDFKLETTNVVRRRPMTMDRLTPLVPEGPQALCDEALRAVEWWTNPTHPGADR